MRNYAAAAAYAVIAWLIMRLPQFLGYMALGEQTLIYDAVWVPLLLGLIAFSHHLPMVRDRGVDFAIRHNGKVLMTVLALNALALPGIMRIELVRIFDASDLPPRNALVQDYEQYGALSEEQNSFVVTVRNPEGIATVAGMQHVLEIEERIKSFEGVDRSKVFSFASVRAVDQIDADYVDISKIATNVLRRPVEEQQATLDRLISQHPLVRGRFLDDAPVPTVAVIQAVFTPHADLNKLYNQVMQLIGVYPDSDIKVLGLTQTVRDIWYRLLGLHDAHLGTAGFVFIDIACLISIIFVAVILSGLAWLLMALFLMRNFRVITWKRFTALSTWHLHADRLSGIAYTMTFLMLTPIIIVMGLLGWLGVTVDTITGIIPIVFIVIASSSGIHLVHYIGSVAQYASNEERILRGIRAGTVPIVMASLTTAIGFITLAGFEVQSIAKFGIYSALGVGVIILLLELFVSAAWFARFPLPKVYEELITPECDPIIRIAQTAQRHARWTWSVVGLLMLVSLLAVPQLHIGSRPTRFLDEASVIPQTTDLLNERFGANGAIFIAVQTDQPDGALTPEFLRKQEEFSRAIAQHSLVAYVQDIAEIIRYMYEDFVRCETCVGLPTDQRTAQELLFLYEDSSPVPFLKHDNGVALMNVWGDYERSVDVQMLYDHIHATAKQLGLKIAVGSEYVLWLAQTEYLVVGKIISWVQSYLLIILLAFLMYGSLRAGIIVTTPLVMVTVMILGVMALVDIPLDISSTVITSITIGIGADFSIHIFSNILQRRDEEGVSIDDAIVDGLAHASPPIIYDAQTNMLGFSMFLFATLLPVQHCGMMLIGSMALASFGALVFVPLLMKRFLL